MQGPSGPVLPSAMGMIPRAVQQIYEVTQKLNERGWKYTMEGQFLEIYNETLHDLLGDTSNYGKIKHDIRHEKHGKTIVTDMTTGKMTTEKNIKETLGEEGCVLLVTDLSLHGRD